VRGGCFMEYSHRMRTTEGGSVSEPPISTYIHLYRAKHDLFKLAKTAKCIRYMNE